VTLNPFSRWSYKEWAPEKWVRIIDWLGKEISIAAVIVGAPSERVRADELGRSCAGKVYNLTGRTTLAELAGVLKQSRLHIGVDSAAPHIAAAVGTPTVTLYGPSDWRYWAPPGERNRVVVPEMACAPCHLKGCEGSGISRCLDTLPVERVRAVIREALST
jgi:heptosyltransferase-3